MYPLSSNRPLRTRRKTFAAPDNDKFLAIVYHELRTPTAAILGWAELLGQSGSDADQLTHGIETIKRNAQLQVQLIDHLLDFARLKRDEFRLDVQRITVLVTLKAALETMMPLAVAKNIRVETRLDPSGWIVGDTFRLQQVFTNLLSNAIKFTPSGGCIRVLLAGNETSIQVKVSDTGRGISAEVLPYIFDGARRAAVETAPEPRGMGLGLEISRRLIERHGGRIEAFSKGNGQGATFTVHFPRASMPGE